MTRSQEAKITSLENEVAYLLEIVKQREVIIESLEAELDDKVDVIVHIKKDMASLHEMIAAWKETSKKEPDTL